LTFHYACILVEWDIGEDNCCNVFIEVKYESAGIKRGKENRQGKGLKCMLGKDKWEKCEEGKGDRGR
jgi:hypothetical protein